MNPELMQRLIDAGYTWSLNYYPSLVSDPECPEFEPKDHFNVTFITSYEDQVEGWGSTADEAARHALHQLTLH